MENQEVKDLLSLENIGQFIKQVDQLERMKELKDKVINSLNRIRELKHNLEEEKVRLKELLTAKIEEDEDLESLIKEVQNG